MSSRFAIKSFFGASLVFVLGAMSPTASAVVSSTTVSGCSLYKKSLGQCTIFVDGILKGLGNVSRNPTAFTATLTRISGTIFCKNPAGNSTEANGTPFTDVDVEPLEGGQAIDQANVSKNGKTLAEIKIHDPEIIQAVKDSGFVVPPCLHSQWIQVIVVTKMQVMGKQISDPNPSDPNDGCYLPLTGELITDTCATDDTLRTSCRIQDPYFGDPASAIGVKSYNYGDEASGNGACTEICHSTDSLQCNLNFP